MVLGHNVGNVVKFVAAAVICALLIGLMWGKSDGQMDGILIFGILLGALLIVVIFLVVKAESPETISNESTAIKIEPGVHNQAISTLDSKSETLPDPYEAGLDLPLM